MEMISLVPEYIALPVVPAASKHRISMLGGGHEKTYQPISNPRLTIPNNSVQDALSAVDLRPEEWNYWVDKSRNGRRRQDRQESAHTHIEKGYDTPGKEQH